MKNYVIMETYTNESLIKNPDRKIRKYTRIIRRSGTFAELPSLSVDKFMDKKYNQNDDKSDSKMSHRSVSYIQPCKSKILKPNSYRLESHIESITDSNKDLKEMINKYSRMRKEWDVCGKIVREMKKINNERNKDNPSLYFYLWRTMKKNKESL